MCSLCGCNVFKYVRMAAFVTMFEVAMFLPVNIIFILMYTCSVEPTVSPPSNVIGKMWTWFFYDFNQCQNRIKDEPDIIYQPPQWIKENEEVSNSFNSISDIYEYINPSQNYMFQVIYLVFHLLWFLSSIEMFLGNRRNRLNHYLPWIFITPFLIILDVVIASFYIIFWDDWVPEREEASVLVAMIFIYLRGFFLEFVNVIMFINVLADLRKVRSFRNRKVVKSDTNANTLTDVQQDSHNQPETSSTSSESISRIVLKPQNSQPVHAVIFPLKSYDKRTSQNIQDQNNFSQYINEGYEYEPTDPTTVIEIADISIPRAILRKQQTLTYFP